MGFLNDKLILQHTAWWSFTHKQFVMWHEPGIKKDRHILLVGTPKVALFFVSQQLIDIFQGHVWASPPQKKQVCSINFGIYKLWLSLALLVLFVRLLNSIVVNSINRGKRHSPDSCSLSAKVELACTVAMGNLFP